MGRWQAGAAQRLQQAALELYAGRGYDETTVAQIAARAGLTERTYFRHFADKREVLFSGSHRLRQRMVSALDEAPASATPMEAVALALAAPGAVFDASFRPHAVQRQQVIDANPALYERELVKLASLAAALADALRRRGAGDPGAALAADAGIAAFRVAFERWAADEAERDFARCARDAIAALRTVTTG